MAELTGERCLRSELYKEINTRHAIELKEIDGLSYRELLIKCLGNMISKYSYEFINERDYLKDIFNDLYYRDIIDILSYQENYHLSSKVEELNNAQIRNKIEVIKHEFNRISKE